MCRCELLYAAINRARIRYVTISKKLFDRLRVEPPVDVRAQRQRLQFRREEQPAIGQRTVIERLLAEPVARQEQRLPPRIPQRKREHPVEAVETSLAPLLPGVDNDLGVGARPKVVAERRQLRHQRLKIVDLPVVDDAHRAVFIELRLVAGDQIDDRQPPHPQPDPRCNVETVAVRSTVRDDFGHAMDQDPVDIAVAAKIEDAGYAAHFLQPGKGER